MSDDVTQQQEGEETAAGLEFLIRFAGLGF